MASYLPGSIYCCYRNAMVIESAMKVFAYVQMRVCVCVAGLPGSMWGSGRVVGAGRHSTACIVPSALSSVADHTLCRWDTLRDVLQYTKT